MTTDKLITFVLLRTMRRYTVSTYIQSIVGKKNAYIAMFDRWEKKDLEKSRYVWLPVLIESKDIIVPWFAKWDLSVFDDAGKRK